MRAPVGRGSYVADGEGEVKGERAPQWAEPSVDEETRPKNLESAFSNITKV